LIPVARAIVVARIPRHSFRAVARNSMTRLTATVIQAIAVNARALPIRGAHAAQMTARVTGT
jgi:hypothetical protein